MKTIEYVLSGFLVFGYIVTFMIPGVKEIPYLFESLDIMLVFGLFLLPFLVMLHTNRFTAKLGVGGFGIYAMAVLFFMQHWPGARVLWIAFSVYLGLLGIFWITSHLMKSPRFPNTWHLVSGFLLLAVCVMDFATQFIFSPSIRVGLYATLFLLLLIQWYTGKMTDEQRPVIYLTGVIVALACLRNLNWLIAV